MMNLHKTFILSLFGAIAVSSAVHAQVGNPEIIYKIHDVTPVKENNETVSCDFSVTLYSRAPQMLSNLSLGFSWLDDVIDNQIKAEKQEQVLDANGNVAGYNGKSQTEEFTPKTIGVDVSVPPLSPSKQISIKSNIKTDRCFLLLQKPILKVLTCRYGNGTEESIGACNGLFTYISPEQGDYYTEFKPISYDEEKQEIENQAQKEKEELENIYENALDSVKRIGDTLSSMKK